MPNYNPSVHFYRAVIIITVHYWKQYSLYLIHFQYLVLLSPIRYKEQIVMASSLGPVDITCNFVVSFDFPGICSTDVR